jgi:branched-chain amino acid transport system permease protein
MVKRVRYWAMPSLAVVVVMAPLLLTNSYHRSVLVLAGINALAVLGLHLLLVQCGQVSLGQNGFLALGAYGTAILSDRLGLNPCLAMAASSLAVALLAYALGRPLFRLQGHFFAIATLGVGIVVHTVAAESVGWTGGNSGLAVPALGVGPSSGLIRYTLVWVIVLAIGYSIQKVLHGDAGRCLQATAAHDTGAALCGIDVSRVKTHSFMFAGLLTALAGGLLSSHVGFLTPNLFGIQTSINLLTMAVIGGRHPAGAILSAVALTILPELVAGLRDYQLVASGALLTLVLVAPRFWNRVAPWTRDRWTRLRGRLLLRPFEDDTPRVGSGVRP